MRLPCDLPWVAGVLATKRLAEETFGGLLVALGAEPEVDGLPGAVDGAVEVAPLPVHSHVRLIDVPRPAARSQVPPHPLLELGREALDPAVHGRVIDLDPTIGQHQLEVAVADRELQVPAHRPEDDLGREAEAAEQPGIGHKRRSRRGWRGERCSYPLTAPRSTQRTPRISCCRVRVVTPGADHAVA